MPIPPPKPGFFRYGRYRSALFMPALAIACAVTTIANPARAADAPAPGEWVAGWYSAPFSPYAVQPATTPPVFANQTVRQTVLVETGGKAIRLRLTNELGIAPLRAAAVHIALVDDAGAPVADSDRVVSFGGGGSALLPTAAPLLSDPVELAVAPLQRLAISIWYDGAVMPAAHHADLIVAPGNQVQAQTMTGAAAQRGPGLIAGIEVLHAAKTPVIVAFGDSITEGWGSTQGKNLSWPQQVAARLAMNQRTRNWSVVNAGMSGNRLLHEGFGQPALARLDRDVLSQAGVTHVILLEGINDIGRWNEPDNDVDAARLIEAYRQIVARAHAHGIKVIGATVLPYKGAAYFTREGETMRHAVNGFIRTGGLFDGVIDFDKVTADPADPQRLRPDFDPGDHLHPNDKGYTAMAAAVSDDLFMR